MNHYTTVKRAEFFQALANQLSEDEVRHLDFAYQLAKEAHRDAVREDKTTRYFDHPKTVAWILIDELEIVDYYLTFWAIFHDVTEDSPKIPCWAIEKLFGKRASKGLRLLTKVQGEEYVDTLMKEGEWRVLLTKMVDRLHNLRTIHYCSHSKQQRKSLETVITYYPLFDLLLQRAPRTYFAAIEKVYAEIRDLCARYK